MEIKVLRKEKDEIEIEFESLTITEILRAYLNKNPSVTFAAWKREHSTMNPILLVKTSGKDAKSVVDGATKSVLKDLDSIISEFKKSK